MGALHLTGLRQTDILDLKRFDLKEQGVYIRTSKTDATLIIQYSDALNEVIDEAQKPSFRSVYLYAKPRDGQRYTLRGISWMYQRLIVKALNCDAIKERLTFTDIRQKTATNIERISKREEARKLVGHATQDMTERYISGYQKVKPTR